MSSVLSSSLPPRQRAEIVVDGPGVAPHVHDCWVEPSAARRAEISAMDVQRQPMVLDPQHGGSMLRSRVDVAAEWDRRDSHGRPVAACIAAVRAGGAESTRIVLRADAGLDDYAAAAVEGDYIRPLPYSEDVMARLEAISVADNVSWAGLPEWAPGQRLGDVTTTFPGLGRICACAALPPQRRVELVAEWLMTGEVMLTLAEERLLGLGGAIGRGEDGVAEMLTPGGLAALDAIAIREREAVAPEVRLFPEDVHRDAEGERIDGGSDVALVSSPMTGLSGGRGALGYGYQYAPVVVAYSPLAPVMGARCAVCGDTLAAPAERSLGVEDRSVLGGLGGCGDAHQWEARRLVTIARAPNARHVSVDWRALLDSLNRAEGLPDETPGWGGNLQAGIIGSPKPGGTALAPEEIARLAAQHVSVT